MQRNAAHHKTGTHKWVPVFVYKKRQTIGDCLPNHFSEFNKGKKKVNR
jgi:hypothetical protein